MSDPALLRTPLYDAHLAAGARMAPFAGYELPIHYPLGVLKEHLWTREKAGLFDVSHMGQAWLHGPTALRDFERLAPGDFQRLKVGRQRYSMLLNAQGGIVDDLMASRPDNDGLFVVVNGSGKAADFALIESVLGDESRLERLDTRGLIALQGPMAAQVLEAHVPGAGALSFMDCAVLPGFGTSAVVSRSGYTGEDGFEISLRPEAVRAAWDALIGDERVAPIGLGARDSLRLEAALPLYGHEMDPTVSPAEAGQGFAVSRARLIEGIPGALRISRELAGQLERIRVGLLVEGAPAREGAEVLDADGKAVGVVTSGGFSPSLGRPIALAFAPPGLKAPGTRLQVVVRGRAQPATVASLPFVPHRYARRA
ncbi:MAG: glycine cleavage system aminomethyltransferase GcvT [Caulobacteraceae bacterium]|nr:glycine cleavage system aminomethyltransferase GcvT [Caulobacteraceae bacterium]